MERLASGVADAAMWFVRTADLVGDRWSEPGLGEWDIRALVGHTSRSLLTVEAYLAQPAAAIEIPSAAGYFHATSAAAAGPAVAARGRDAGGCPACRSYRITSDREARKSAPRGVHAQRERNCVDRADLLVLLQHGEQRPDPLRRADGCRDAIFQQTHAAEVAHPYAPCPYPRSSFDVFDPARERPR